MDSKLARKMAYKKKLEEEYREFQERCKYEKKPDWRSYESRLCDDNQWSYQEISMRKRRDESEDEELTRQKLEEERRKLEEEKLRKQEEYLLQKEKWRQKKEECSKRTSRFFELKKKRNLQKKKEEETKKILMTDDLWEELDQIIRENENALKDLKQYQVDVKELVAEKQKRRQESRTENKLYCLAMADANRNNTRSRSTSQQEKETNPELDNIYAKIKELEHSIVSLDFALERYELDKMREKTNQVKQRMSVAVGDDCSDPSNLSNLSKSSIDMFLKNSNLWEKYKSS